MEEEAKGFPFLNGSTLKLGEREEESVLPRILALRASRAAEGEKGSWEIGSLGRSGLPAKAWNCKLMDMVGEGRRRSLGL